MEVYKILQNYFQQLPIELQLVWVLSAVLGIVALIFIAYLKILRNSLRNKEALKLKYLNNCEGLLLSFLFEEDSKDKLSEKQNEFINTVKNKSNDSFRREVILETLLKLKNEVSGEIESAIQEVYLKSNLKDYAYLKLKSKKWYIIANGIKELTQFKVKEAYPEIKKLIKHPTKEVRKKVQLYLVSLFHFKGLEFLSTLKTELSEWDQIELLEELKYLDNQEIPEITGWLNSKNNSVVMFALKLVKIYNKYEDVNTLIQLLNHKTKKIRLQVIEVLTHLQVLDAKDILKSNFKNYSKEEQIAIFKLLDNIYEPTDEKFILENCNNNNFEIQFLALKMLKSLNEEKFIKILNTKRNLKQHPILNFVQNN